MKMVATFVFSLLALPAFSQEKLPIAPGSGIANGLMGVIFVPSEPLAKTLPSKLSLAPELKMPNGTYPVAVFIGQHENLRVEVNGKWIQLEDLYSEATLHLQL